MLYKLAKFVGLSLIVFSLLFITMPKYTASANTILLPPTQYNREVDVYAERIQSSFGVRVKIPVRQDGYYCVGTASLATLEDTLHFLSADFLRTLSLYYKDNYDKRLTFEFAYLPADSSEIDTAALGLFRSDTSTIYIYIPTVDSGKTVTGCGPFTILHEVGHAYHLFLANKSGATDLQSAWRSFNGAYKYDTAYNRNPDRTTFMTVYSAFAYEEDFAEAFAYAFGSNRTGLGISDRFYNADGSFSNLGRKVSFIDSSLTTLLETNSHKAKQCISTMKSTPSILFYGETKLTGNSLEYIGFNQPHGVLDNILVQLKINPLSTEWLWEVGGWKVRDRSGGVYIVFPGAQYVTLEIPKRMSS